MTNGNTDERHELGKWPSVAVSGSVSQPRVHVAFYREYNNIESNFVRPRRPDSQWIDPERPTTWQSNKEAMPPVIYSFKSKLFCGQGEKHSTNASVKLYFKESTNEGDNQWSQNFESNYQFNNSVYGIVAFNRNPARDLIFLSYSADIPATGSDPEIRSQVFVVEASYVTLGNNLYFEQRPQIQITEMNCLANYERQPFVTSNSMGYSFFYRRPYEDFTAEIVFQRYRFTYFGSVSGGVGTLDKPVIWSRAQIGGGAGIDIRITEGMVVRIARGDSIWIGGGRKLTLEDGATLVLDEGSNLNVLGNSELVVNGNVTLRVLPEATIRLHGKLTINAGAMLIVESYDLYKYGRVFLIDKLDGLTYEPILLYNGDCEEYAMIFENANSLIGRGKIINACGIWEEKMNIESSRYTGIELNQYEPDHIIFQGGGRLKTDGFRTSRYPDNTSGVAPTLEFKDGTYYRERFTANFPGSIAQIVGTSRIIATNALIENSFGASEFSGISYANEHEFTNSTIRFTSGAEYYATLVHADGTTFEGQELAIINLMGQQVSTLTAGFLSAGHHSYRFDAVDLPNGVYIVRLIANGMIITRKMTLLK